jgi:hypothetical protein
MSLAKKIFIISTTLLAVVLFFWGAYNFIFKENDASLGSGDSSGIQKSTGAEDKNSQAKASPAGSQKMMAITDEGVVAPAISQSKDTLIYHSAKTGKVMKIDFAGKNKSVDSSAEVQSLTGAQWSAQGKKAILKIDQGDSGYFDVYDYADNTDKVFKGGVDTLVWDNLGDKVLYKYFDSASGKRTLNIANPDGSDWKVLTEVSDRKMDIAQIPQTSIVSFWNSPDANTKTNLRTVSILGGEVKTIYSDKYGADFLWAPNGQKVLISGLDNKGSGKLTVGTANVDGSQYANLNIPTLAEKCVWSKSSRYIYCALPNDISEGVLMPNDYIEGKINTVDTFWRVEISTGKKDRVLGLDEIKKNCDATNLVLSPDEKKLFFVNRSDGDKLYVINL